MKQIILLSIGLPVRYMLKNSCILALAFAAFLPLKSVAANDVQRSDIEPLLKSEWGQDAPFYYATPTIDGQHCRTGCGATALSQVLYYHKYPRKGNPGIYSYETSRLGKISFDFTDAVFDFDVMKDVYQRTDAENDPSVEAVARLMLAAGVTLNMDYGLDESSALFGSIPTALRNWFLYPDDGMRLLSRDFFTNEEWEQIIYNELKNNRPVLYLGGNSVWSHIFVCDGYKEGKFHMNWGWYGEKEGYFSLTNLQTERVKDDGILNLNSGQRIIVGVRAPERPLPAPVSFASSFAFDQESQTFALSEIATSYNSANLTFGVRVYDENGRELSFWNKEVTPLGKSAKNVSFNISFEGLSDGKYTLRPVYRFNGDSDLSEEEFPVYCNPRKTRYLVAEIEDEKISSITEGTDADINVTITDFTIPSSFIKGETYNASFSIFAENNGNTTVNTFKLKFYKPGTDIAVTANEQSVTVHLTPGESKSVVMALPQNLPAGEYDMYIVDGTGGTQTTYPVLGGPIRVNWRDNSGIFVWDEYKLRVMALSEDSNDAILLKNKPNAPSVAQGLKGDLIIPENIARPEKETMAISSRDLVITELGPQLAYNETGLERLVIPGTVKNIGSLAFAGCTGLNRVEVNAIIPPVLQTKVFDAKTLESATLIVPGASLEAYKGAEGWKDFANIVSDTSSEELTLESFEITPGGTVIENMKLKTETQYYGCQFDMELPDGLSIIKDEVVVGDDLDSRDYAVACASKTENSYIIILYSNNHNSFPQGTLDLVKIPFSASESFQGGTIKITNIEFAADGGEVDNSVEFEPTECLVTLEGDTTLVGEIEDVREYPVDIYNISGVMIRKQILPDEAMATLPSGLYIMKSGNQARKILVRR